MSALLADKGYDADYVVDVAKAAGAEAVIPPKSNRKILREYDKDLYKERNHIERLFNVPWSGYNPPHLCGRIGL